MSIHQDDKNALRNPNKSAKAPMSDDQPQTIYKIATNADWTQASAAGRYRGSLHDLRDGFIHFSTRDQLDETARKHFSGHDDLLLIAIDATLLRADLKWEPSRGGALFPHLYSDLPTASALWIYPLPLRSDGTPDIDAALERARS